MKSDFLDNAAMEGKFYNLNREEVQFHFQIIISEHGFHSRQN